MPIRKAQWKSDTQFNFGPPVKDKVEIVGSGDAACLQLVRKSVPTDHITFSTPSNYVYDPARIVVTDGAAKLLATVDNDQDWPFTTPANYTYDANKIEVVGGEAKLKGSPITCYAQWHMNEASGANVPDSSGNGRDATCINMEDGDWVPGKINNCLRLNEGGTTDEYINCGSVASFELTDSFSFDFWLKVLSWPTGNIRVIYKYDGTRGYLIYIGAGRVYVFLRDKVLGGDIHFHGSTPIGLDTWYHIVLTYDGSEVVNGFELYVNNSLETKTVLADTLAGGNIVTAATLKLGGSGVSYFLDGYLDEVVVYDKELNAAEIAERWNSGNGSELMPGAFPVDAPPILPVTGMAFTTNPGQFVETATKQTGTDIKYHVSSDDGVTWKYWNGSAWVVTDDSYAQANTAVEVNVNVNTLASSGTFKFRALLHSSGGGGTPILDNIYLAEGVSFPTGSFEIVMDFDIHPVAVCNWLSAVETVVVPSGTALEYQYSTDGGAIWNGSWLTEPQLETAVQGLTLIGDGTDKIRFKFQLTTTDALKTPEIDDLAITYSSGYESNGSYTSYAYAPAGSYLNGFYAEEITFDAVIPTGTTLTIHARAVEHVLEENYDKPWTAYNSGDTIGVCGTLIQFEAVLATANASKTPKLNWIEIGFHLLIGVMRVMDEAVTDIGSDVKRLLGLNHENAFIDNTNFDGMNQLVSCRIRLYDSKTNAEAAQDGDSYTTGLVATYVMEAVHEGAGKLKTYRYVKSP